MDLLTRLKTGLVGRYEIERELGAGGMATVYLARDLKHNRKVALKVLRPDLGAVLGAERFFAEIEVTANLQHPNLLPLFDSGEADGQLFYVMPYVEGESLRARLEREKQLPVDQAVHIGTAVASALHYAHRHGIVHRDLKPENILLHEGQPLVADFGIALAVSNAGGNRITQTGLSLGTPHYMSPEQATGDRVVDARTDVYSLGAVTYEMLTGEPPHAGSTSQAVIARLLTETPRSIRSTRPNVPEHVERAVARALEKLPADRLATAQDFADALTGKTIVPPTSAIHADASAAERRAGATHWREVVRHPAWMALAVLAVAGMAGTIGFGLRANDSSPGTTVRFEMGFEEGRTWIDGPGSPFALSPDGSLLAYVGAGGTEPRRLYVRPLADLRARELPGTEGANQPFFSPDGNWIGFLSGNRLMKAPVDGGTPMLLTEVTGLAGASWTDTDRIIVSVGYALLAVPAAGGTPSVIEAADTLDGEIGKLGPLALLDRGVVLHTSQRNAAPASRIAATFLDGRESQVLDLNGSAALAFLDGILVYASDAGAIMAVPFDLGSLEARGTATPVIDGVAIGAFGGLKGSVSASGSVVYLAGTAQGGSELLAAGRSGAVAPIVPEERLYAYPRYSPDGRHLAFAIGGGRTDVWILDLPSGPLRRLTTEGTLNDRPEWTPDGRNVVFRSNRDGRAAFWIQPADGNRPAEPYLATADGAVDEVVPSADGAYLIVQIDTTRCNCVGTSYYRRTAGDTTFVSIAGTIPGQHTTARLSPDARWVAYRSDETGGSEVYVKPFPTLEQRYQVSLQGGEQPVWSRDGRRLYYLTGDGLLLSADLSFSSGFSVVARDTVLANVSVNPIAPTSRNHANYDVSPDGSSFAFIRRDDAQGRVIVVHDWRTELLERMGASR